MYNIQITYKNNTYNEFIDVQRVTYDDVKDRHTVQNEELLSYKLPTCYDLQIVTTNSSTIIAADTIATLTVENH